MAKKTTQTILSDLRKSGKITNNDLLTPKGTCNWCIYKNVKSKAQEHNYGAYSLNFIDDGSDAFNMFIKELEEMRDVYCDELMKEGYNVKLADIVTDKAGSKFVKIKIDFDYDKTHSASAMSAGRNYTPVFNKNGTVKIFDKTGKEDLEFDSLIGNGSVVKVLFYPVPYYMASSKLVGISLRLKAIQVIKLNEYKKDNDMFSNESDTEDPFNKEYKPKTANAVALSQVFGSAEDDDDLGDVF